MSQSTSSRNYLRTLVVLIAAALLAAGSMVAFTAPSDAGGGFGGTGMSSDPGATCSLNSGMEITHGVFAEEPCADVIASCANNGQMLVGCVVQTLQLTGCEIGNGDHGGTCVLDFLIDEEYISTETPHVVECTGADKSCPGTLIVL